MNSKNVSPKGRILSMLTAAGSIVTAVLVCFAIAGAAASGPVDPEKNKIPFPRPLSHGGNWIEYHGRAVEPSLSPMVAPGNTCLTCHERTDCVSCHNTRAPRDHTNTWRTLSHGFMAEGDSDRCRTCHKQDFCVRCHNETAPRSHRGDWSSRHCTWCHFSSGFAPADSCLVCHKKAPHTSAPHTVNPQSDCSLCHH
jgi:hypothetical protein